MLQELEKARDRAKEMEEEKAETTIACVAPDCQGTMEHQV